MPHFYVVFALPTAATEIAFQNKKLVYTILFKAAAETLPTIAADPKHLGSELGVLAVLYTWRPNLHHHPHIHCVAPGGGLSLDDRCWIACRLGFFLPCAFSQSSSGAHRAWVGRRDFLFSHRVR